MKKICLLGATGSIGKSTFELVKKNPDKFKIVGASGHAHFPELEIIAQEFNIPHLLNTKESFDYADFLKKCEPDIVLNAIVGFTGLKFSIETLQQKIPLALANKESLVAGGKLLMQLSQENKTPILPVDSEHSAIFQCLNTSPHTDFKKIILTCSGGPFWGKTKKNLEKITIAQALKHPNWSMGAKISIDSATLANKCLEFFEAMHLFGASKNQIQIVIHRESIVHSMVEFPDSSIIAQLSPPTMKLPIALALNFPKRENYNLPRQIFSNLDLSFRTPDKKVFRTLELLEICTEQMQNFPIVFNAANEIAVENFLNEKILFSQIFDVLEQTIHETKLENPDSLEKILEIDKNARVLAQKFIRKL
ncbi:1-deoxy-D-xylulose-5-phosphate reductoisomerase [Candidatus Gracilibacteria bacterium]|nr:1-deoxy-D-xylulose-5-phosphate reductoisomerase [Candidatus Gracilibacteria bacterium]